MLDYITLCVRRKRCLIWQNDFPSINKMLLNVAFTLIRKSYTGLEENRNDLRWGLEVWKERRLWNPEPDGPLNQRIYEGLCWFLAKWQEGRKYQTLFVIIRSVVSRYKLLAFYAKGAGTYFYSLSAFYEGQWRGDQRSGRGQMQYENGELYEGEWLKDKHHGQGLLLLGTDLKLFTNEPAWWISLKHVQITHFYHQKKKKNYVCMYI